MTTGTTSIRNFRIAFPLPFCPCPHVDRRSIHTLLRRTGAIRLAVAAVDALPALGIEEVQSLHVHDHLERLALLDPRPWAEASEDDSDSPAIAPRSAASTASAPTSWASSFASSVKTAGALIMKCTRTSAPKASRRITDELIRWSAGASGFTAASSMSSGRMPTITCLPSNPLRSG